MKETRYIAGRCRRVGVVIKLFVCDGRKKSIAIFIGRVKRER